MKSTTDITDTTDTRGKKFLKKLQVELGMDLYKGQKQGMDEKTHEHYPYYGMMAPSSLASNAMHLHP